MLVSNCRVTFRVMDDFYSSQSCSSSVTSFKGSCHRWWRRRADHVVLGFGGRHRRTHPRYYETVLMSYKHTLRDVEIKVDAPTVHPGCIPSNLGLVCRPRGRRLACKTREGVGVAPITWHPRNVARCDVA